MTSRLRAMYVHGVEGYLGMTSLVRQQSELTAFRWRDRDSKLHRVSEMRTAHVFYVLRMIWNHSMPEEARTHNYRRYRFDSSYTVEYMQEAARVMLAELERRDDLDPALTSQLCHMREWATRMRLLENSDADQPKQ